MHLSALLYLPLTTLLESANLCPKIIRFHTLKYIPNMPANTLAYYTFGTLNADLVLILK